MEISDSWICVGCGQVNTGDVFNDPCTRCSASDERPFDMIESKEKFSVVQFFADDSYETVAENVSAEVAMEKAKHYTSSVAAQMGMVKRVIITDSGDMTNFEWEFGKGVVFPVSKKES